MTKEFLLYLVIDILSSIVIYKAFRIFFKGKEKYSEGFIIFCFIIYHLINVFMNFVLKIPHILVIVNLVSFFCLSNLFQVNLKKKLVFSILLYSLLMLIESISILICSYISYDNRIFFGYVFSQIINFIALGIFNQVQSISDDILVPKLQLLCIISFPLGGLIIFLFIEKYVPETIILICLTILLAFNILVMYIFDMLNKEYIVKLKNELKLQEKHSESQIYYREKHYYENQLKIISESQGQIRTLKHDLKTHQFALRSLLENKQVQESLRYLDQISNSIEANYLNYVDTDNIYIDSILNYKISLALNKNILIKCQIKIPNHLNIEPFDISVVLGNLLDNAIEAEEVRENDDRIINLIMKYDKGCFYLKITNKFIHNLNRKNGVFLTHKEDSNNHGLGLKSVKRSVEKYNGILSFDVKDDVFCAKVFLYL